ncbi:AMP-binding protein [Kitasatospora hibisci]|uniref:AMP-binding protein n=1 Tax=Kitasatospora hibisci TaxID=3369522 RepID=UPI003754012E
MSSLRHVVIGAAPVLQGLVDELRETLGARTYSLWGMSEFGPVTITRLDYNQDWAAHSHGGPIDSMEIRIDNCNDPSQRPRSGACAPRRLPGTRLLQAPGRLRRRTDRRRLVRHRGRGPRGRPRRHPRPGPSQGRHHARRHRPADGRTRSGHRRPPQGHRGCDRRPHRPHRRSHPRGRRRQRGHPPTLEELRTHLRDAGQDARFLPERLEVTPALPKTLTGKVRKVELRKLYATAAT